MFEIFRLNDGYLCQPTIQRNADWGHTQLGLDRFVVLGEYYPVWAQCLIHFFDGLQRGYAMYRLTSLVVILFFAMPAFIASADELQGRDWGVTKKFRGDRARLELSGATCPGTSVEKRWCLIVNDEKRWAQFFSLKENMLKPKSTILLLPKKEGDRKFKEIDAEAAAYDDGYVYVTGSHGMSRRKCKFRQSQFYVFRFPVDKETGKPKFSISHENVAPEIERSDKLRQIVNDAPSVGRFAEKCLDDMGVNFEGLAVTGGKMFFGLRGPSIDGHAFVLEVSVDRVFGSATADAIIHKINLGNEIGIRDLARVDGGLLILTGHANEGIFAPQIFFWNLEAMSLTTMGELPVIPAKKAETILVIEEESSESGANYRVLILYDGLQNGNPTEFVLER